MRGAGALPPTVDPFATLSALGNQRVQRMLTERDLGARPPQAAGAPLQRQDEGGVEDKKLPPTWGDMIIGSRGLPLQAKATLDGGKSGAGSRATGMRG